MKSPRVGAWGFSYRVCVEKKNLLRRDHLLALLAQFFDSEGHHVARFEKHGRRLHAKADAGRGPGADDVARLHHEKLRAVPHQVLATEDHGLCISALTLL